MPLEQDHDPQQTDVYWPHRDRCPADPVLQDGHLSAQSGPDRLPVRCRADHWGRRWGPSMGLRQPWSATLQKHCNLNKDKRWTSGILDVFRGQQLEGGAPLWRPPQALAGADATQPNAELIIHRPCPEYHLLHPKRDKRTVIFERGH